MDPGRKKNDGRGSGAGGRGRGRGRGHGRGSYQTQGAGGRGWDASQRGSRHHPPAQHQWANRSPVQGYTGGNQPPAQQAWGHRPPPVLWSQQTTQQGVGETSGRGGAWTGGSWGQSRTPSSSSVQSQPQPLLPPRSSSEELDVQSLKISTQQPLSSLSESRETQILLIRRPDDGGTLNISLINLLVNHFPVNFDEEKTIIHYDVDVKPQASNDNRLAKKPVRKSDLLLIKDKLFSDYQFPILETAYDGGKNIFSAVPLSSGQYEVDISDGEDVKRHPYVVTVKFVNELKMSKLKEYLRRELSYVPRDILQAMDLVMKQNPSRQRICVGRSFYLPEYAVDDDLKNGVALYRGFQQSLKPTSNGLALCLDHSVSAFHKPMPVIEFLLEHVQEVEFVNDIKQFRQQVNNALNGLKVQVTHRRSRQKYTIAGLAAEDTCDSEFHVVDPAGENTPTTKLVTYFLVKWGKDIRYKNIPCLELGKNNRSNKVPMEFCVLVTGQRYPKEYLGKDKDKERAQLLKKLTVGPRKRKDAINETMRAGDGPYGGVASNFGIGVDETMTEVVGRVIGAPELKLGGNDSVGVDKKNYQWNLVGRSLVDGKSVERWALLDFTEGDQLNSLKKAFISRLRARCQKLGIRMEEPLLCRATRMTEFSSVDKLEKLLTNVVGEANKIDRGKLQMIVCVMARKDPGYKFLKWVSETRIGVVTQCCLSPHANRGQDQYLANLCLKINAKLGGNNFELMGKLPHFDTEDHVMFIGADVNHPGPLNSSCPSIAAVVGTVNWPAANRYAARVRPQVHRQEKISNFGTICLDLVKTYAEFNKVKPNKLVVFRDGVSEGQFQMVLAEELVDLKNAIYDGHYKPKITLIVAQKRHQTRLFAKEKEDEGASGNVPPGTVVDTKIVNPVDFDFYLCSYHGSLGTIKPTHYIVLHDENSFTSDELQKLIYDMCFTFVRCTKPISLVPPVAYADLLAYRGRMFQQAAMESGAVPSSSDEATSTSSSSALFDQSFFNLHSDLKSSMFFV